MARFLPSGTRPWLLVGGALSAALMLFSPGTPQAQSGPIIINFGTAAPDGTPWADQLKKVKADVEAKSGGRIKMKLFLGGALGGEVEMIRDIRRGSRLQGGGFSTAAVAEGGGVAALQIPELPYLFNSLEEADYILDNVLWVPVSKAMEEKGFVMSAWSENGWRNFGSKKKAIRTIQDLREHKMRVQESEVHQAMYAALGVKASVITVVEVLPSLQTNAVDGFDNTLLFTQAAGWHESIKYYTLSEHIYQPAAILYSKKLVDSLPPDLRVILLGDKTALAKDGRNAVRKLNSELLANFKAAKIEVYTMTAAEKAAFANATKGVQAKFRNALGPDLLQKVNTALTEYRKRKGTP